MKFNNFNNNYLKHVMTYIVVIIITLVLGTLSVFLPLNIFLSLIAGIAILILIFFKPEWGIGIIIASMLYEREVVIGLISLTRIISIPILLICLIKILLRQKKLYITNLMDPFIFLLFLWMTISIFYATNLESVTISLLTYFQLIITYITIKSIIDNEIELERLMKIIIFLSVAVMLFSLFTMIQNVDSLFTSTFQDTNRVSGPSDDPNKLALGLVFLLPLTIYLLITKSKFFIIPVAIFSFIILSTFSRGGIIGMTAVFLLSMIQLNKKFKNGIIYSIIFIVLLTGTFLALNQGNKILNRMETIQGLEGDSIKTRLELFNTALDMTLKNPILGVGLNNFMDNSHLYGNKVHYQRASHNAYLEVSATLGLPGLILLLTMLYLFYRNMKTYQNLDVSNKYAQMVHFINISFIAYLVSSFFLALLSNKLFWVLLAFSNIIAKCSERIKNESISNNANVSV
jgi:putative inorganic carbon (hco3(-)) transporter